VGTSARAIEELAQIDLHRAGRRSTKSQRAAKKSRAGADAPSHRRCSQTPFGRKPGVTGETLALRQERAPICDFAQPKPFSM